ncbi:MAG: protein-export chaperone SecB [Alphaproteobacteria bacterium]|nr:protein-export chaperone SecB [Alphaproteobacteria bacterium]MBL0717979.1 protein-export chaperone SecB [Alphaproteobacteria bacterium]
MAPFKIFVQYLSNLSFTSPMAPALFFKKDTKANINVKLDVKTQQSDENTFLVSLSSVIENKLEGDKDTATIFTLKIEYNAVIQIDGSITEEEDRKKILLVYVPTTIFPAFRQQISDITTASGYPQFNMEIVDFESMYTKNRQQKND